MPYNWSTAPYQANYVAKSTGEPGICLYLSSYNSLTETGFVWFITITSIMMLIPIFAFLGHSFLWIIAGTLGLTLWGIWRALKSSWYRGRVFEVLEVWSDYVELTRVNPNGSVQRWSASPYWTEINITKKDGPVRNYLTLRGSGKTVEIGSFLSEDERPILAQDLRDAFKLAVKSV